MVFKNTHLHGKRVYHGKDNDIHTFSLLSFTVDAVTYDRGFLQSCIKQCGFLDL